MAATTMAVGAGILAAFWRLKAWRIGRRARFQSRFPFHVRDSKSVDRSLATGESERICVPGWANLDRRTWKSAGIGFAMIAVMYGYIALSRMGPWPREPLEQFAAWFAAGLGVAIGAWVWRSVQVVHLSPEGVVVLGVSGRKVVYEWGKSEFDVVDLQREEFLGVKTRGHRRFYKLSFGDREKVVAYWARYAPPG